MINYKKAVSWFCIVTLLFHLVAFFYVTFKPAKSISIVFNFYRYFVHLGPFFTEDRIQSAPHVSISVVREDTTLSKDITMHYVRQYQTYPWRYHALTQRDFVRHAATALVSRRERDIKELRRRRAFQGLHEYALAHFPSIGEKDTIHLYYAVHWYRLQQQKAEFDTVMHLHYTLNDMK